MRNSWARRISSHVATRPLQLAVLACATLITAADLPAQVVPLGPSFQVSRKDESIRGAKTCSGDDGNFVAAWHEFGLDGAVFTRLYSDLGAPEGSAADADQGNGLASLAGISCQPDRSFTLAWQVFNGDGEYNSVFAARFDSSGTRLGSPFQVNVSTVSNQRDADVATSPDGSFLIAWTDDRSYPNERIFARAFDSAGTPLTGEFQVNSFTSGHHTLQSIATNGASAMAVWSSIGQDGAGDGIFAQRMSLAGALLGTEFQVPTYTESGESNAGVAASPGGDFIVVWEGGGQDGSGSGIFAQRFASGGARDGTEFQVNTATLHSQLDPKVAADAAGDFVVVWLTKFTGGIDNYLDVFARRFLSSGVADGPEFQANDFPGDDSDLEYNNAPWVSSDAAGGFVISWRIDYYQGYGNPYSFRDVARRFGIKGPPVVCGTAPIPGCISSGKSLLALKDKAPAGTGGKDKFIWKWLKGPATSAGAFGDPVHMADYALCVYAGTASATVVDIAIPQDDDCDTGGCWKPAGSKGYGYTDGSGANGGITKISLKGGDAGKAKILVKGIEVPSLPLDDTNDVTVQLRNDANSNCWQSVFQPGDVIRSNTEQYKAKRG